MLRLSRKGVDTTVLPDANLDPIFGEVRLSFDSRDLCRHRRSRLLSKRGLLLCSVRRLVISADVSATVTASLAEDLTANPFCSGAFFSWSGHGAPARGSF